jgi:hypothetical protein
MVYAHKGMQDTLRQAPEHFGLYNNGITLVVSDFKPLSENTVELANVNKNLRAALLRASRPRPRSASLSAIRSYDSLRFPWLPIF